MNYAKELKTALEAATHAGRALVALYAQFQRIANAPADITTEADRQAQEIILGHLHERFPDDALCAEEDTPTLTGTERIGARLWVVDPIDGTRGFARKNGEFSVMVAFVDQGQIGVGVVLEPAFDRLTYAVRGGGCWMLHGPGGYAVRCCVRAVNELKDATLTQSRSHSVEGATRAVKALRPVHVVETYSAGIKLALVARGQADVYVNTYTAFHDWDICAGQILVEEAGGKVTGLAGEPLHYGRPGAWQRHGLLATNGALHEAALTALLRHPSDPV